MYKIKNKKLLIECNIEDYDDIIIKRMFMFDEVNDYDDYLIINYNQTVFKINNKENIIHGKIKHTDLYQLINNIISNIINDDNNIYIHSAVIFKKNKGILLLGDFHSGKSTICLESRKNNYEILSADQSWLTYEKELWLHKGSKYLSYKDNQEIINEENKKCKIDAIFVIKGVFDDGNFEIYLENEKYRGIKNISKYCTWSINNVLMTDDFELNVNRKAIHKFISKINVPIYYVFGNKHDIIKKMEEI